MAAAGGHQTNEADKWKPRTNFRKEKRKPAPTIRNQRSWPSALNLFEQDFLKEFREKNPNDKSSDDAVSRAAADRWKVLTCSPKFSLFSSENSSFFSSGLKDADRSRQKTDSVTIASSLVAFMQHV